MAAPHSGQWEPGDKAPGLAKLKELVELSGVTVGCLLGLDADQHGAGQADSRDRLPAARSNVREAPASGLGPHALAEDADLVAALRIEPTEWAPLASLETPTGVTKLGYVSLLALLRECATASARSAPPAREATSRGRH